MNKKVLFIVKRRQIVTQPTQEYSCDGDYASCPPGKGEGNSSGLYNSVRFTVEMLQRAGVECKVVQVIDNNCIDREVRAYKPDIVVIEAIWVVPEKFHILHKLHPKVKWMIRIHSEIPFLSMEGNALDWLFEYIKQHPEYMFISANSERVVRELTPLLKVDVSHTPNIYPLDTKPKHHHVHTPGVFDISCFGAVRPLKNHLIQAISAIEFAEKHNSLLRFHINGTRIEGRADNVLKNVRHIFRHVRHELVEHPWLPHDEFVKLIQTMDMGMQVSFSETYNIVAADHVDSDVPMVASDEIKFVLPIYRADPTDSGDIVHKMECAWNTSQYGMQHLNKAMLEYLNHKSVKDWLHTLKCM